MPRIHVHRTDLIIGHEYIIHRQPRNTEEINTLSEYKGQLIVLSSEFPHLVLKITHKRKRNSEDEWTIHDYGNSRVPESYSFFAIVEKKSKSTFKQFLKDKGL